MKRIQFVVFALAIISVMTTTASATPRVPDATSTAGLLGFAVAGLAGLRVWLKK